MTAPPPSDRAPGPADPSEPENLLHAALEAAPNAMLIVDEAGFVRFRNAEFHRLFGYPADQPLQLETLVPSPIRAEHEELRRQYLARPRSRPMGADRLLHGVRANGVKVPLEIGLSPLAIAGQRYTIATIVDISERVRIRNKLRAHEAELTRKTEAMRDFVYAASHDLQEPLRKVAAFCQLIEQDLDGKLESRTRQYLHFAVDGAHRMQQMIRDLLTLAELTDHPGEPTLVDTSRLVAELIEELSPQISEGGVSVVSGPLPDVLAPSPLVRQIFRNLLSNSIKYRSTERPPRVEISGSAGQDLAEFRIVDNGIGIPEASREAVFRLFHRLHSKEYLGTGMGLTVVQKALERLGGTIRLDDTPGGGLVAVFTLPAAPASGATHD